MSKYARITTVLEIDVINIRIAVIDMIGGPVRSGHLHTARQAALLATENIASFGCNHTD